MKNILAPAGIQTEYLTALALTALPTIQYTAPELYSTVESDSCKHKGKKNQNSRGAGITIVWNFFD